MLQSTGGRQQQSPQQKSDITQVYELGHRLGLPVMFEEEFKQPSSSSGGSGGGGGGYRPAKVFSVRCKIGRLSVVRLRVLIYLLC